MIHGVYIIHDSGICLVSRDYEHTQANIDLFSGYLSAIFNFALIIANDTVLEIKMERKTIFYYSKNDLVIAIITENGIANEALELVFEDLLNQFFLRYGDLLYYSTIHRDQFIPFKADIDEVLIRKGIIEPFLTVTY